MSVRPLAIILAALAAGPLAAAGEERAQPEPAPESAAPAASPGGPLLHGKLELALADAIDMGLENNLSVQVARFDPVLADLDRETLGDGGLQGIVPLLGTQYKAAFEGSKSTTNSSIISLSPEYDSNWTLDVTQPLLRDLIWNQPWIQVRTSRILLESSQEGFRRSVMDIVQSIENAYWTLIARDQSLRVAQKSLETTQALLDQTKTQYEVGVVSKVEVTEAEAGLARREVELIRARNDYRNQQDVLIDLVLGPNLRAASTLEIRPTDQPGDFVPYEVDVEAAVRQAFRSRPEIVAADKEIERQRVQLGFRRNQILPALDGFLTYGQSGLSGNQSRFFDPCRFVQDNPDTVTNEVQDCKDNPPNVSQGGFSKNFDDYNDSPTFVGGVRLSIPFPNTVARKGASRTEFELRRAETSKRRLEQQIIVEVRQAARNLLASQEGITAAESARKAAAEQLRAEEIRLEYGESTPFEVLQREEDLVDSERQKILAYQAYRTSVTALDRAQGTILRNRNIKIADVAPLR
jgi:outer membrane protein